MKNNIGKVIIALLCMGALGGLIAIQVSKNNDREQARLNREWNRAQSEREYNKELRNKENQRARQEELERNKSNAEYQIKRLKNERNTLLNELSSMGVKMSTSQKKQKENEAAEIGEELIYWIEMRLEELRKEKYAAIEDEDDERAEICQEKIDRLEQDLYKLQY